MKTNDVKIEVMKTCIFTWLNLNLIKSASRFAYLPEKVCLIRK